MPSTSQEDAHDQPSTSAEPQVCADTPRKKRLKKRLFQEVQKSSERKRKIRVLGQKLKRYKKRIESFKGLVKELNNKNLLRTENAMLLENTPDIVKQLQKRKLQKKNKYSPELRKFAITLSFFSPKGYDYVRSQFDTCLPNRSTISKWFKNVDAEPGFTQESLNCLRKFVSESKHQIVLSLVVDEISLRKQIEWNGKKMIGYVNCGIDLDNDCNEIAKEAFVLMVVCVNGRWKLPVGYFFSNSLSGSQKSAIILQCCDLIRETGARLISLTFDGAPSNIAMAQMLGCSFDTTNMKPFF